MLEHHPPSSIASHFTHTHPTQQNRIANNTVASVQDKCIKYIPRREHAAHEIRSWSSSAGLAAGTRPSDEAVCVRFQIPLSNPRVGWSSEWTDEGKHENSGDECDTGLWKAWSDSFGNM
jgi:hypothetical protein